MKKATLFASLALLASTAFSQTLDPFYGDWKATWKNASGRLFEGRLVLAKEGSTWQNFVAPDPRLPCVGRKVAVDIQPKSEAYATLLLKFSEALRGCEDVTWEFSLVSPTEAKAKGPISTIEMVKR